MTDLKALNELEKRLGSCMKMIRMAPMAQYTTLRLGGPADMLAEPGSPEQLVQLLQAANELNIPVTLIGHGSNLLVKDGGVRGLVIRICREMRRIEVRGNTIRAEAGAMLSSLAMTAAENSLGGLVFASGIPGTVGGGVYMNAGAYGGEMSQVVSRVEGVTYTGEPFAYTGEEMQFAYRYSRLMEEKKIVTHVTCKLPDADREKLISDMVELNRRRAEKQPLTLPSAGSTFKRPVGGFASAMVDECGLKGKSIGGAQVSEKHAGFLVNRGGTAADFLALIAHVQKEVYDQKGVMLEPEVCILGEDAPVIPV
ncbi:MAG: UDP-N-acetylmuramate dehydrogenase [Clostridiales bacterium]|nr:UDP-N-acetylmuramate dehydrogenase [Clostridiales bacterium]